MRELGATDAVGEGEEGVFAGGGVHPRFERWGGAAEDDDRAFLFSADDGGFAGVVAGGFALFVAGFVFFVDDDGAEILEWGEDGGAGADDDAFFAAFDGEPGVVAFAVAQGAVEDGDLIAEDGAEAVDGLGGEGDFWDEDDGALLAGFDDGFEEFDVDQCLAAAGDAVEDEDFAGGALGKLRDGGGLFGRGEVAVGGDFDAAGEGVAVDFFRSDGDEGALFEPFEDGRGAAELVEEMLDGTLAA